MSRKAGAILDLRLSRYRAIGDWQRTRVPGGVAKATGQHMARIDETHYVWEYDSQLPDGTPTYSIVEVYKKKAGAGWTGACWEFRSVESAQAFEQDVRCHGGVIGGLEVHATVEPVWSGWRLVRARPDQWGASWLFNFTSNRAPFPLAVQDGEGGEIILVVRAEELARAVEEAAAGPWPTKVRLDGADDEAPPQPLPVIQPARIGGWRVVADVSQHPLAIRVGAELGLFSLPPAPYWDVEKNAQRRPAWHGKIMSSASDWPGVRRRLEAIGIPVGELPPVVNTVALCPDAVPGWSRPTSTGRQLHGYQRAAVEFVAAQDLRAVDGDEMGLGKTAEAIAAAEGTGRERILVVCPAVARWVWDAEVRAWARDGEAAVIYHVRDTLAPAVPADARWVVVSYDQLVTRRQSVPCPKGMDSPAFKALVAMAAGIEEPDDPEDHEHEGPALGTSSRSIVLAEPLPLVHPELLPEEVRQQIDRANHRLTGPLLTELQRWRPDLVIADEAHRVKNRDAKRTKTVQGLLDGLYPDYADRHVLLLTGTPLRNAARDAESLLRILDPGIKDKGQKLSEREITSYLQRVMIRRRARDVVQELPDFVRQRWEVELTAASAEWRDAYHGALETAARKFQLAYLLFLSKGKVAAEIAARQAALPALSAARHYLGMSKAVEPATAELIASVVEDRGCAAVFAHHLDVLDHLHQALGAQGLRVVRVDGGTPDAARKEAQTRFQSGEADVFLGGITVMESIGVPRADVGIFAEFDWVPAVIQQAEGRLYRPAAGSKTSVHIVQATAKLHEYDTNLDAEMLAIVDRKLAQIRSVLGETEVAALTVEQKTGAMNEVLDAILRKLVPDRESISPASVETEVAAAASAGMLRPAAHTSSRRRRAGSTGARQ